MLKQKPELIIARGKAQNLQCDSHEIADDKADFITDLVDGAENGVARLPANPPFEIHPYKDEFPLQNYEKYIIGTFPPISYIYDEESILNSGITNIKQPEMGGRKIPIAKIPFYHGNRKLMWDYLLINDELLNITLPLNPNNHLRLNARHFLINKLIEVKINYADIIDKTQRNLEDGKYNGRDHNLNNICINKELVCHILSNKKAKYLLFNTASIYGINGVEYEANGNVNIKNNTKSFDLFIRACQEFGLEVNVRINSGNPNTFFDWQNISNLNIEQRKTKIAFELKISNPIGNEKLNCNGFVPGSGKHLIVLTPYSPAFANKINLLMGNPIFSTWRINNPLGNGHDFLKLIYQSFRENNFNQLFNLNR